MGIRHKRSADGTWKQVIWKADILDIRVQDPQDSHIPKKKLNHYWKGLIEPTNERCVTQPHNAADTDTLWPLSQNWRLTPISQFHPPLSPGGSSVHPTPMSHAILCLSSSASSRYVIRWRMVGRQVAFSHRTDGKSNRMHSSATRFSSKSSCSSCRLRLLVTPMSLVLLQHKMHTVSN